MDNPRSTFDTETVRRLISHASGKDFTARDIHSLTRKGRPLHRAQVRRGSFSTVIIGRLVDKFTRRRLAQALGRISPRFLDDSHSRTCPECRGLAVEWDGRTLCENGHQTQEGGSPEQTQ
jgi:hypothetical protein